MTARPDGVLMLEKVYALARVGDWDAVESFMADDFVIHEPPSLPYGGEWRGKDALRRLFGTVMGLWQDPHVDIETIVGDDTHVVALMRFAMTSPHTGERFVQHVAEVTTLSNGLIAAMRIHYFDSAEVARQAGMAITPP